uniref:Uncharacterized protein n=1 Tax=Timema shepardi TaxID=629360 RepID=A0A7R9G1S9_TIMSH|nr:unnamed protein product [Timema shepardi]
MTLGHDPNLYHHLSNSAVIKGTYVRFTNGGGGRIGVPSAGLDLNPRTMAATTSVNLRSVVRSVTVLLVGMVLAWPVSGLPTQKYTGIPQWSQVLRVIVPLSELAKILGVAPSNRICDVPLTCIKLGSHLRQEAARHGKPQYIRYSLICRGNSNKTSATFVTVNLKMKCVCSSVSSGGGNARGYNVGPYQFIHEVRSHDSDSILEQEIIPFAGDLAWRFCQVGHPESGNTSYKWSILHSHFIGFISSGK